MKKIGRTEKRKRSPIRLLGKNLPMTERGPQDNRGKLEKNLFEGKKIILRASTKKGGERKEKYPRLRGGNAMLGGSGRIVQRRMVSQHRRKRNRRGTRA